MLGSCRVVERARLTVALVVAMGCGSSGPAELDGGGEPDAARVDDAGSFDAGDVDAGSMSDAATDAAGEDGGLDAGATDGAVEGRDSGTDAGTDPCPSGVFHEPTSRCFFLVTSGGANPCPAGSRRARWFDRDDQLLVQSFLGRLGSSPTTSLRRRGYISGAPWVWEDGSEPPSGLVWASTGHPNLTYAYLTPDGLVPYHSERPRTLCERSIE